MDTIKFFSNFKNGKMFISGQDNKGKWFSLWKSEEFNKELYLYNDLFKDGVEIEKSMLKLHDDAIGCRVLVFKNEEDEKKYCISKEQAQQKKEERNSKTVQANRLSNNAFEYIDDIIKELFACNRGLRFTQFGLISKILSNNKIGNSGASDEYSPEKINNLYDNLDDLEF